MQSIHFGNRKFRRAFELTVRSLCLAASMIPLLAHAATNWVPTRTEAFLVPNAPASAKPDAERRYSLNSLSNPPLTDTNFTPLELSQPLHIAVALKNRNLDELDRFLRDLNQPGSASYHKYLTPAQFKARFSPSDAQVATVVAHLKANGFRNVSVSENNMLIFADGNAGNAESAFSTSMKRFNYHGKPVYANDLPAQVPPSLGSTVDSVLGLQNAAVPHPLHRFAPEAVIEPNPIPENTTDASQQVGHQPTDFAKIYDASSLPAGTNTTVGIIAWGDMTKTIADLNVFTRNADLPTVNTAVVPGGLGTLADDGNTEWRLDSQCIIGTSGGVRQLIFYSAANGDPHDSGLSDATLTAAYNKAVTDNKATIINVSLGIDEDSANKDGSLAADDALFKQAYAQGQIFSVSSGDAGAYIESGADRGGQGYIGTLEGNSVTPTIDLSKYSVGHPASSPYVVAVGGTTLSTTGATMWAGETAWNEGVKPMFDRNGEQVGNAVRIWATGGGVSKYEAAPSWQTAAALGSPVTKRALPDVAFDAGQYTGAYIIVNGQRELSGGTSLSSPIFVGGWARLESANNNSLGLPTPKFYQNLPGNPALHHDVTSGNNGYGGHGYTAKAGWDNVTGFGSLNFAKVNAALPSWPAQ
ncbi:S53 family peptidase [Paraburkholderia sp. CNPSo 3274]|uniref:S53 family peptidase n=1 Tax=unclassified Paraburkholderia TaxID=2615204 RepID=UPI0020B89EA0|nr:MULTISPECIES: S53 family peptidase [unclassified Paraburkholderia]MCP3712850.1 S53 family peptidase [Paraburkholderia sp. CNPSo 3274]MCP3718540.1 S53 family peptidase [Paraburkholderia sp. CNPSo 3281]